MDDAEKMHESQEMLREDTAELLAAFKHAFKQTSQQPTHAISDNEESKWHQQEVPMFFTIYSYYRYFDVVPVVKKP